MRSRVTILSLLPMLLFAVPLTSSSAQDNPYASTAVSTSDASDTDDVAELKARLREANKSLAFIKIENKILKEEIKDIETTNDELRMRTAQAETTRDEMHQALFERLFLSAEPAQQQLALEHLFSCGDKYPPNELPINVYTAKLLKRMSQLTDSESTEVKMLAAKSLFTFKPEVAIGAGIQFGPSWKPVGYFDGDMNTRRILASMEDSPCPMIYDEDPLVDVIADQRQRYHIEIRLKPDVDQELLITYESSGRTLFNAFNGMLEEHKLGFAIVNEEVVIMKATDPDLIVQANYNIAGLASLAQVDTDKVIQNLKASFDSKPVEINKIGDHLFTVKATEPNQRKIQKSLGELAPTADWYAK